MAPSCTPALRPRVKGSLHLSRPLAELCTERLHEQLLPSKGPCPADNAPSRFVLSASHRPSPLLVGYSAHPSAAPEPGGSHGSRGPGSGRELCSSSGGRPAVLAPRDGGSQESVSPASTGGRQAVTCTLLVPLVSGASGRADPVTHEKDMATCRQRSQHHGRADRSRAPLSWRHDSVRP